MDTANSYDVLLVAPEVGVRDALAQALQRKLGARVSAHSSARDALSSYSRARFDVILCDSGMESPDCWCLLRMIRSGRFGFPETPAFICSPPEEKHTLSAIADNFTQVIDDSSPNEIAEFIDSDRYTRHRPSVLLVEDEESAREAATRSLVKYFNVAACSDAESALLSWRVRFHDLVILDLMLPGMSGAELLPRLLQDRPDQPVIILTAYDAAERHQELMLSGATEFLSKPISLHDFPGLCSRVLNRQALLQSAKQQRSATAQIERVGDRLMAAQYLLSRGRTAEASLHLQRAMDVFRVTDVFRYKAPGDDQWTILVQEFEQPTSGRRI